jgi:hypothetical protein
MAMVLRIMMESRSDLCSERGSTGDCLVKFMLHRCHQGLSLYQCRACHLRCTASQQPGFDLMTSAVFLGTQGELYDRMRILVLIFRWRLKSLANLCSAP